MMLSLSATKPAFAAPAARNSRSARPHARSCRSVTRAGLFKDDPSATKEAKEAKHKDTFWAEPKNNNPLEKSTGMRESFTSESSDQKAESAVNKATKAATDRAAEVADKVSEAGSNMVEGTVEQMKEFTKKVGGGDATGRDT